MKRKNEIEPSRFDDRMKFVIKLSIKFMEDHRIKFKLLYYMDLRSSNYASSWSDKKIQEKISDFNDLLWQKKNLHRWIQLQVIQKFLRQESENLHDDLLLSDQDLVTYSIYFARFRINVI